MQELDSRMDALRHQAANPPEAAELRELGARKTELDEQAADLRIQVDDLSRAQRKADDDVEQVRGRRSRDQLRLDSGQVSNPKDLERLQHELVSLDRRIGKLEDEELEVMEQLETAQTALSQAQASSAELTTRMDALNLTRTDRLTSLKEEAAGVIQRRKAMVADLPPDLLTLYEKLREQKGGVGAALLRQRRCNGCSLELNASDLADLARLPSNEVSRCEECNRILVRTGESGI